MKKYDVLVIGLGPAGIAVTGMAAEMGLSVLAVESRNAVGGGREGAGAPTKALVTLAEKSPMLEQPFARTSADIDNSPEELLARLEEKAEIIVGHGPASFVSDSAIRVGGSEYTGKHIFIATGTRPFVPPIRGLDQVDYLTRKNFFELEEIPESLTVIGGGAIGCEMAQAFARAGSRCTIVHDMPWLLPNTEKDAGEALQRGCERLGITVYNARQITGITKTADGHVTVHTRDGLAITSERLLLAAGRSHDFSALHLEKAGVEYGRRGIHVDDFLCTTNRQVYAIGDCNGSYLHAHAATHQGMQALTNALTLPPAKRRHLKYPVPWTVFTEPQVSHVGRTTVELDAAGIDYEMVETTYGGHDAATGMQQDDGYVRVYCSSSGRIYGVSIVGAETSEMINEWALAIQNEIGLYDLMTTMHSYPTMSFLSKRIGDSGLIRKMRPGLAKRLLRFLF